MYQVVEQLVNDTGIKTEDANYIFATVTGYIVTKVPALKQVIEDVFTGIDEETLNEHIDKLVVLLQQQSMVKFKAWQMPQTGDRARQTGSDEIL